LLKSGRATLPGQVVPPARVFVGLQHRWKSKLVQGMVLDMLSSTYTQLGWLLHPGEMPTMFAE